MNASYILALAVCGQLDGGPQLGPAAPAPPVQIVGDEPTPAAGFNQPPFAPTPADPPAPFNPPFNPASSPRFAPEPTPAAPQDFRPAPSVLGPARGEIAPTSGIGDPRGALPVAPIAPAIGRPAFRSDLQPTHPNPPAQQTLETDLLIKLLATPQQHGLAGHPLTLETALGRTSEPARRLAVVKHYWFVTYLVGEYHGALNELGQLQNLSPPQRAAEQKALAAALAAAQARTQEAELNAVVAQYELAELAVTAITDTLPLPADRPLVSAYNTEFERMFAGRSPPVAIRRIARTLPLRHGVVAARASSMAAALDDAASEAEAFRGGQAPLAELLAAQERVRENRTAFLMAVRQYNFEIAEYALSIASPGWQSSKVVEMLLGPQKPAFKSVLVPPGGVVPVAGQTPLLQPVPGQVVPAAFNEPLK